MSKLTDDYRVIGPDEGWDEGHESPKLLRGDRLRDLGRTHAVAGKKPEKLKK